MKSNIPYLLLAMSLASGRTIASKKMSSDIQGKAHFFQTQMVLFISVGALIVIVGAKELSSISALTVVMGLIYGLLLVLSQWMLTLSLKDGNTSFCSIIYSLGFIIPTLSGAIFWNEMFTIANGVGLLIAIVVIALSANKKTHSETKVQDVPFYIYIAMIASGGLGLMQKIQQSSKVADEKMVFFLIAFAFAFLCSWVAYAVCRQVNSRRNLGIMPIITGLCFGGSNVCNTVLAGRLPSAIFFPVQNISTLVLSTLLGILLFKEKMTLRNVIVLLLGVLVIVLFSVSAD